MWFHNYWGSMPLKYSNLKGKKLAKYEQDIEFLNAFQNYFTLAMNQFEWSGFTNTMDARFFERSLLLYGKALLAKVDGSYLTLAGTNGAGLSLYGYPTFSYGWGLNGYNKEFSTYVPGADESKTLRKSADGYTSKTKPESVMCWDNVEQYPMVSYIMTAANRVSDIMKACDVGVQALKVPFVVSCDESEVKSVEEALNRRTSNVSAIVTSASINPDSFRIWQTGVNPDILNKFWEHYKNIDNQTRTIFGINSNESADKRERLLVDEINVNNQSIEMSIERRLATRQLFCEWVKDCFGLELSVEVKKGAEELYGYIRQLEDIGGNYEDDPDDGTLQGDKD